MKIINMWEHQGRGNKIEWISMESRKLMGCMTPLPAIGDEVRCQLVSKQTNEVTLVAFTIQKVEPMGSPRDSFKMAHR